MKGYTSETIRNVALVGHGGCGKTTFLESALLATGVIDRLGKVEDGNTVSDYDKMEIEKGFSINTSIVPVEWKDSKINFIDTPGYFDFIGEVNAALRASEAAVILVDAGAGIQVGTEQAWKACERYKMPRFIVINKRDKDEFDFYKTFNKLKAKFGETLIPFSWPLTAEIDEELKEAIAMTDDLLMEKYFNGDDFSDEEIKKGLVKGISEGGIVPVCSSAFSLGHGIEGLLDLLVTYVPTPLQHGVYKGFNDNNEQVEKMCVVDATPSAFVFKTIVDPFVGKISIMKVVTGKLTSGMEILNERTGKTEKLGKLFFLRGKEQQELNYAEAGDIVAVAKLQHTVSGDTLCDKNDIIRYLPLDYPSPSLYVAIEAVDKKTQTPLEGVKISVVNEKGKKIWKHVTLTALKEKVIPSWYTIQVEKVPKGYQKPKNQKIKVKAVANVQKYKVELTKEAQVQTEKRVDTENFDKTTGNDHSGFSSDNTPDNENAVTAAKTGDASWMEMWIFAGLMAASSMILWFFRKKRHIR